MGISETGTSKMCCACGKQHDMIDNLLHADSVIMIQNLLAWTSIFTHLLMIKK